MKEISQVLQTIGSNRGFYTTGMISGAALPHAALAYSLGGEDLALARLFKWELKENKPGIYVDIGCGDPVVISNSYYFYCRGWRGLCVDANNLLTPNWSERRSRDVFVASAIGETEGRVNFYRHDSNTGRCKISAQHPGPEFGKSETVEMTRLDFLLEKHIGDETINFMNLDVEGSELGVLKSNNWDRWRPKVILMECCEFSFASPDCQPSVAYLLNRDYELSGKIGDNVLMVACN